MTPKINVAVLISGGGSNLQSLIDACKDHAFPAEIICVISNTPDAYGLKRAENNNIPALYVPSKARTRTEFEADIDQLLGAKKVDLICLAGFMRILSAEFINKWEGRILNIHPSLLPKFGGEGMYGSNVHKAVLDAGETYSGASVHLVTAGVDEGPVLLQKSVQVHSNDSIESLAARVLEVEHEIYPLALAVYARQICAKAE